MNMSNKEYLRASEFLKHEIKRINIECKRKKREKKLERILNGIEK